jgi:hypothetical protein
VKRWHLVVPLAIAAIALPLGASATTAVDAYRLASDRPSLHAIPFSTRLGRAATTQVELYVPWGAGEMARVAFFVPSGYHADLSSPPGAEVGFLVAWDESGGRVGRVLADVPEAHIANSCAPGLHESVWLMELNLESGKRLVPLYVDRPVGGDARLGGYKLQACFPSSVELGMRIAMLELDLDKLRNPSVAGGYTWRAFVTPYGEGVPDEGRTFELRSTVPLPMTLTIRGRYDRASKQAVLTGRFVSPGFDVSGMPVELRVKQGRYFDSVTWTRTRGDGRYSFRRRIRGRTTFATATSAIADCEASSSAPLGCLTETWASVASAEVKVTPRRRSP